MKRFFVFAAILAIVALASAPAFATLGSVLWTEDWESYSAGTYLTTGTWAADTTHLGSYAPTAGTIQTTQAKDGVNSWKQGSVIPTGQPGAPGESSRISRAVGTTIGNKICIGGWIYCGSTGGAGKGQLGFQKTTSNGTSFASDAALVRIGANSSNSKVVINYYDTALRTFEIGTGKNDNTAINLSDRWTYVELTMQKVGATSSWDVLYSIVSATGTSIASGTAGTFAWDAANANSVVLGVNGGATSLTYWDGINVSVDAVPEPGSMLALGTGLVGLLGLVRRKRS